jgi:hypothetical protein
MENLKGRSVEINSGARHATRLGEIISDLGDMVVVRTYSGDEIHHFAKFRVISNEYLFGEIPDAVGVYLIAKPILEECA